MLEPSSSACVFPGLFSHFGDKLSGGKKKKKAVTYSAGRENEVGKIFKISLNVLIEPPPPPPPHPPLKEEGT